MSTAQLGTVGTADGPGGRLNQEALDYAASRGISQVTLERFGAASGTEYFPRRLKARSRAVYFPYLQAGEVVNYKACAFPEKDFIGKKGGTLGFLNFDNIVRQDTVYMTEGEWDAAALNESGIPFEQITSVPNGARETKEGNETPGGYGYVEDALEAGLCNVRRFVWCGDGDDQGRALRRDMARILGPARFHYVEWPEGCKDANAMLISDGPEAVRELVMDGALEWPVEGLFRMADLPEPPKLTLWDPGFPEWDGRVRLAPGTMSVVTGHPGHGKTQFFAQVWYQIIRRYQLVACVASFETRAKPHMRRTLRTLYHQYILEKHMTEQQAREADAWINEHYVWLQHPDQRPTLEWALDMAEVAVIRHGARIVQIDPWNRLESQRPQHETETEYIGRCLTSIYTFAQDLGVHVQILAHPAKMDGHRKGKPPELEDIAGSKHWDNRVDQGFVIHRPNLFEGGERKTECEFYHRKARFEELGYPCKLKMEFLPQEGRYWSVERPGVDNGAVVG